MYNSIFWYYGLLAILTQLVAFRELSVLFCGNELFLGTFLSSWLFWVGLGSLLARRLLKREEDAAPYFSYALLAVSLFFPTMILLIRASKSAFAFGEFIGPVSMILYTFSMMSILCFVIGGQFSLACAMASAKARKETAMGRVYLYEALGAAAGGILFTYMLIGVVPTFIIAVALSLGCIFAGALLLIKKVSFKKVLLIAAALSLLFINFKIEPAINRIEWKRYRFIEQRETRNDTLSLVDMGSIKNIFVDGLLSASFPNPEGYEPPAHWPLLASPHPRRILIIGDTSLGVIKEALKHKPERMDYVVLDGSFLNTVRPYLKDEDILALKDPATHIHYSDPRTFVRDSKDEYDVVIINIQEVPNLKTNRFYTQEFYSRIKSILKLNGILALGITSSENYLSPQTLAFNASVYRTLKSVFDTVEVIPGDIIMFLASPSSIEMRKPVVLERFYARKLSNHCVIPSYIEYKLEPKRRVELTRLLDEARGLKVNKDFRPTTCYYFASFWLNKFASPLGYLGVAVLLIAITLGIFVKRRSFTFLAGRKETILIFVLGFLGILLELVLLLGYQIISGYVYWQMGLLFASFMSGLFLGSLLGNQFKNSSRKMHFISLVILSLSIAVLAAWTARMLPHLIYLAAIQNIFIFVILLAVIGSIVGAAFILAGFLISEDEIMVKAGSLYAADLWGASLSAILSTNLIVPLFGILGALNLSAVIGLMGLVAFLVLSRRA